jgi:branched-chain amino acid transport system permease protein
LLAIHDDEDAAEVNGVPTFWLKMGAFALSSFFAGVMGAIHALYVSYVTVGETFNITVPLTVVLMSVLGGSRHWAGPMLGGILITLLLNAFTAGESALVGKIIIGLVLAGAVLVMPRGILGTWQLRQHKRLIQRSKDLAGDAHASNHGSEDELVLERPLTRPADAPDRQKVLEVRGLSKHFSGIRALNQVDLDLYQGEILGLLGPNGSGKSTFINVVTGHYRPTAGSVLLRGQSCAGWPAHRIRRQGLSRTYQIPRPFNGLTVLQNVTLAAHYGGARLTDAQALAEAREWMLFTGLQDKGDHFPDELNLHQRKFLELARALAARPQVLLLDEVLSGLTPSEIGAAVQTIRRIRERGTSIVFVEHVMSAVLALSDRLVVLNQGEVIAEGHPQDVMSRPEVVRAYLGDEAAV